MDGRFALGKSRPSRHRTSRIGRQLGRRGRAFDHRDRPSVSPTGSSTLLKECPMLSRREFIERTSLVSLYPIVPSLFGRIASAATAERDARTLVVIQLDGGNDGINTVVPFGDDGYARNRRALRVDSNSLHKLNDHVGLHPAMNAAKELFDDGRLTIVQGVGYPNPDRSHFRSMRIWQTASLDSDDHNS